MAPRPLAGPALALALTACSKPPVHDTPSPASATPAAPSSVAAATAAVPTMRLIEIDAPGKKSLKTVAGDLSVAEVAGLQAYEIRLAGKALVATNADNDQDPHQNSPIPSVIRDFGAMAPFDQVLLVRWDGPGNACNGYGFSFLQLRRDGTASFSKEIPYCGGPDPTIALAGGNVTLTVPEHEPNRGSGKIAQETWVYTHGEVTQSR